MIDLHCHLLPGVDDGPEEFSGSARMLVEAQRDGISTIFCTSHSDHRISARPVPEELCREAAKFGIELQPGAEYNFRLLLSALPERLQTLGNSSFLLLEFDRPDLPLSLPEMLFSLTRDGKRLIIAHPERSFLSRASFQTLADCGAFFQLTAGSFLGTYGRHAQKFAREAVENGFCHYIASDAHGGERGFPLTPCRQWIAREYGAAAAELFFQHNPRMLLEDREPESRSFRRTSRWSRLFGKKNREIRCAK